MCYLAPTTAAIITSCIWQGKKTKNLFWLVLMFYGGALFGLIDHLWNKELFLVSENWPKDMLLGLVITAVIILAWRVVVVLAKSAPEINSYLPSPELK
jgi:hypothetical protein